MRVNKELSKGSHELIILKLLSRQDMYGYQLIQQMALLSEDVFCMSQGSLYPFLHTLEDKGYIQSYDRRRAAGSGGFTILPPPAGPAGGERGAVGDFRPGHVPPFRRCRRMKPWMEDFIHLCLAKIPDLLYLKAPDGRAVGPSGLPVRGPGGGGTACRAGPGAGFGAHGQPGGAVPAAL